MLGTWAAGQGKLAVPFLVLLSVLYIVLVINHSPALGNLALFRGSNYISLSSAVSVSLPSLFQDGKKREGGGERPLQRVEKKNFDKLINGACSRVCWGK